MADSTRKKKEREVEAEITFIGEVRNFQRGDVIEILTQSVMGWKPGFVACSEPFRGKMHDNAILITPRSEWDAAVKEGRPLHVWEWPVEAARFAREA